MGIYQHMRVFDGKPVIPWNAELIDQDPLDVAYAIRCEYYDELTWIDQFNAFLDLPRSFQATALIIGMWDPDYGGSIRSRDVVRALANAAPRLQALRAIFFGDITAEESEISWIEQTDVGPLLDAYPALRTFGVRGGNSLLFGYAPLKHAELHTLIVESGGLSGDTVQSIASAHFPALEHLELWLGDEYYGANWTLDDLSPVLSGNQFPNLKYLGLRDSDRADELAQALAKAPVMEFIDMLDLSLGTLSDVGAKALARSPALIGLEALDIHHHYCSDLVLAQLMSLGIQVDARDAQTAETYDDDEHRYVAVSE